MTTVPRAPLRGTDLACAHPLVLTVESLLSPALLAFEGLEVARGVIAFADPAENEGSRLSERQVSIKVGFIDRD